MNHRNFERKWRFRLGGSTLPPVAPPPPSGAPRARLGSWPLPDFWVWAPAEVATAICVLRDRSQQWERANVLGLSFDRVIGIEAFEHRAGALGRSQCTQSMYITYRHGVT